MLSFLDPTRLQMINVTAAPGEGSLRNLGLLSRFERLRQVELEEIDLESEAFPQPKLEHVEELVVSADKLGERSLAWIAGLPKLRVLYLRANHEVTAL